MRSRQIEVIEECAFEPESTEIRCVDCDKPTGVMGTCRDIGFCAECRASYVGEYGEIGYSEMLITMIEGENYNAKYKPRRVLHLSVNDKPLCGVKGGPHPLTTNRNEANCKRCVTKSGGVQQ
jgi:hypothetical protein